MVVFAEPTMVTVQLVTNGVENEVVTVVWALCSPPVYSNIPVLNCYVFMLGKHLIVR